MLLFYKIVLKILFKLIIEYMYVLFKNMFKQIFLINFFLFKILFTINKIIYLLIINISFKTILFNRNYYLLTINLKL